MGIYECFLPWCLFWKIVRDLLIWKICSFTKLSKNVIDYTPAPGYDDGDLRQEHQFLWQCFMAAYKDQDKKIQEFPDWKRCQTNTLS